MLNIFYGNMPEAIFNTSVYFKNAYEDVWITDPVAREMILDVDKSVVLDSAVIDSPVMGKIAPKLIEGQGIISLKLRKGSLYFYNRKVYQKHSFLYNFIKIFVGLMM